MTEVSKKHTLKFDPRTELLLLVLANIVAFTQHSVWVEITWVVLLLLLIVACGCGKSAGKLAIAFGICLALQYYVFPNGPKILANYCILCKKDFPLFDCRYNGITENARPGIDGCTSEMAYPAGIDYSFVCNCPIFSGFKRRNRLYPGCHEAP